MSLVVVIMYGCLQNVILTRKTIAEFAKRQIFRWTFTELADKKFPLRVPSLANPERYRKFDEVYGTKTDDSHQPSKNAPRVQSLGKTNVEQMRDVIYCKGCEKPRLLFAGRRLSEE